MRRRDFLTGAAAAAVSPTILPSILFGADSTSAVCCDRTYATPEQAMQSPRETLLYVPAIYTGTASKKPDYLATVDVDPESETYSRVVHRVEMPHVDDELHHFGWNACSSCHGAPGASRRFIVLPGLGSSRIHILDTADPRRPRMHKVIAGDEVAKTDLSAPHTVHCLADGHIMISMLGNAKGEGPGGFLLLDQDFEIVGRWDRGTNPMEFNYDFWYQPRFNVMVSSEWAAPKTIVDGFHLEDVKEGKYGRRLHFWDWVLSRDRQAGVLSCADRLRSRPGRACTERTIFRRFRARAERPRAGTRDAIPRRRLHLGYLGVRQPVR